METLPILPDTVLRVESPLKWIEDIASQTLKKRDSVKSLISSFQDTIPPKLDNEDKNQEENTFTYHAPCMYTLVVGPINVASIYTYVNDQDKALILLKEAEDASNACLVGDHKRARKIVQYMIEVIRWSISVLKSGQLETSENGNDVTVAIKEFQEKWSKLMKDNKSMATVEYVKAKLKISMGASDESILESLKNAIQLDPDYFLWHHVIYNCYRDIRLKAQDADDAKKFICVSNEEMSACSQSYKIRPSVLLNIFTIAGMLREDLWIKSRMAADTENQDNGKSWTTKDNDSLEMCLNLLSEALEIANFHGYRHWAERITLEKARALLDIKHMDRERVALGEEILLKECPERFPDSSNVFNNVGIYYKKKAGEALNLAREYASKAQQSFKLSIEKDPGDFRLLMSYIHFLRFHPHVLIKDYIELFELVNNALEAGRHELDLQILRGCLIWIYNPEKSADFEAQACKIWVDLLKKHPEAMGKLVDYMENPNFVIRLSWGRKVAPKISYLELTLELNKMRKMLEMDKNKRDEETLQTIFNLWVMGEMELPSAPPIPIEKEIAERNFKKADSGKYVIPQRNKNSSSTLAWKAANSGSSPVADLDSNWRK